MMRRTTFHRRPSMLAAATVLAIAAMLAPTALAFTARAAGDPPPATDVEPKPAPADAAAPSAAGAGAARGPSERINISGTVRTSDGSALPENLILEAQSKSPGYTQSVSLHRQGNRFTGRIRTGSVFLNVASPGYAPAVVGPLDGAKGDLVDVQVTLSRGFRTCVRLLGADGGPLAGVRVTPMIRLQDPSNPRNTSSIGLPDFQSAAWTTDAFGAIAIEHWSDLPVQLEVWADGYQHDQRDFRLKPDQVTEWKLAAAKPVTGRVLSEGSGKPVADAKVKLMVWTDGKRDGSCHPLNPRARVLATTDAEGRFAVTQLRDDCDYALFVGAETHGACFLEGVRAGQTGLDVWLGSEMAIRGKIIGDLTKLGKRPQLTFKIRAKARPDRRMSYSLDHTGKVPVKLRDGVGRFEIRNLWPTKNVLLRAGGKRVTLDLTESLDDVQIDLGPAAPPAGDGP